jgi:peptide/nickel transport system permease protein
MVNYVIRRLFVAILTLLGASVLIFGLIHLLPGDLVTILYGIIAVQNEVYKQEILRSLNLDRPFVIQYLFWLRNILFHGNLGRSLATGLSVAAEISRSFPVTCQLLLMAIAIALTLSVPLGILSATRSGQEVDISLRVVSLLFLSVPAFFIGMVLIILVSKYMPWVPILKYISFLKNPVSSLKTMLLPSLAVGFPISAILMRFVRGSLLEVLQQDYIRTVRAKGLSEWCVLYKHALKNAFIPVLAVAGMLFAQLMGSLVVVEEVFALPGIGQLLINAIYRRDYTMIQGVLLFLVTLAILINLILDLAYSFLDPRITYD